MLHIAICEDDKIFINRLKDIVESYFTTNDYEVDIHLFFDGEDLVEEIEIEENKYDVIFLDIDMPILDGINAARMLREMDKDFILVFLTSLDEEVYRVFELDTYRFIRKTRFNKEIGLVLESINKRLLESSTGYDFKTTNGLVKLMISDILYFRIVNRKVNIITLTDSYVATNTSFNEVIEKFTDKGFVSLYRGMIVNIRYIKRIDKDNIELDNGEILPVSRYKMPEVKKAFLTRGD